jgi:hypothetical protein
MSLSRTSDPSPSDGPSSLTTVPSSPHHSANTPSSHRIRSPIQELDEPSAELDDDHHNPVDPDHIAEVPEAQHDDDQADIDVPKLSQTLRLLANNIAKSSSSKPKSGVKPRAPDTFDGMDPSKLDTFIFQVSMYVAARSDDFRDHESRVTFAMSYLKGTPLDWFQTELSQAIDDGDEVPAWFRSFKSFTNELKRLFGPRDPVTDAMTALENLRYKDSTKATRYSVDFNRHARRSGWNDQALTRQYYKGLPDRIKDEIARLGKPADLKGLQDLVGAIDQRHWERQSEINRDRKAASSSQASGSNKASTSDSRSSTTQTSGSKPNSQSSSKKPEQRKFTPAPSTASASSKPAISDMLGPDGKLKPEERKRRMDNRLCLRCGDAGHTVTDCPRTSKPKPKGRAASASATASSSSGPSGSGKA